MREWRLRERARLEGGVVAHDRFGDGPPLVLVHGTPASSYLWRVVGPELARRFSVHVLDLLGYGDSEKREGQDVSIGAQARMLVELVDRWGLERPAVAGHDIGAAVALRTHLCERRPFGRIAVIDGVVFNPWNTAFTMHVRAHENAYRTMPVHIYEQVVAAHLRTAVHRPMPDATLDAYLAPWRGSDGQAAYLRKIVQIDERQTAELEPRLGSIGVPTLVIWGERDAWLPPALASRIAEAIPGARLSIVPDAGHLSPEDAPDAVVAELQGFLGAQ